MLWTPHKGIQRVENNLAAGGSTTPGTAVTTGAAAGTKGTAAELIASTAFDAYLVYVTVTGYGAATTGSDACLDILVGAATEEVLIPNLLAGCSGGFGADANIGPKSWLFPLYIPSGTRVAAQAAGRRTSTAMRVAIWLFGGDAIPPFRVGSKVTTYGVSAVPNGVSITPGASGAEGSWAAITASTSEDHFALVPSFQLTNDTNSSARAYSVDIGYGAATEEEIYSNYLFAITGNEMVSGPLMEIPIFQDIPSGTRLTMRASSSGTAPDTYDGAIHAVS